MAAQFEWDGKKALQNLKKHGVAFEEAVGVFADPLAQIFDDPDHSMLERRQIIVGNSINRRTLIVSFTDRDDRIRLISARPTT